MKILIIEDSIAIRESVRNLLANYNYKVFESSNGITGLECVKKVNPGLILLDVLLPGGITGYDVCETIRKKPEIYGNPFILMLTSKDTSEDVVHGFAKGADDYLRKPFNTEELIMRVKSLFRRNSTVFSNVYKYCEIIMDDDKNIVSENGVEIKLSKKEYELLRYLIINKGILLSRDKIMEYVWEAPYYPRNKTVDTYINKLKNKLESLSEKLIAERGFGYKLCKD